MNNRLNWLTRRVEVIRKKYLIRMDADEGKSKKSTGLGTRLPYALCKEVGIDTTGMTPEEAWDAYKGKTGANPKSVMEEKVSGADKKIDPETGETATRARGTGVDFQYTDPVMQEYAEKVPKTTMDTGVGSLKGWKNRTEDFVNSQFQKNGHVLGCRNAEELADLRDKVQKIFDNTELCSQVDARNVKSILESGLKNQFETGTTNGSPNLKARRDAAETLFGISPTEGGGSREKYGFIADKDDYGLQLGDDSPGYGDVCITLKKDNVANRTTYTADDSLFLAVKDKEGQTHNYAAGAFDTQCTPEGLSFLGGYVDKIKKGKWKCVKDMIWTVDGGELPYVEAQFHGDVTAKDIDAIKFGKYRDVANATKEWTDDTWKIVKENNIKIVYFDDDMKPKTMSVEEAKQLKG